MASVGRRVEACFCIGATNNADLSTTLGSDIKRCLGIFFLKGLL